MARLEGISAVNSLPSDVARIYEQQTERYGSPLVNHMILARCPEIFRGFRAMWDGIESSGLLAPELVSLVYVKVASLIGCSL